MNYRKKNYIKSIFIIILLLYTFIYFFYQNNYYQKKISNKVYLNEENIKKFENDIKENKILDINSYITYEEKDYSNNISRLGEKLNDTLGVILIKGTSKVFNELKKLVW